MLCPDCQRENPDQARFCRTCGAPLRSVCPQCEQELAADDVFCFSCGAAVTQATPVPPLRASASPAFPTTAEPPPVSPNPTSFANGRYQVNKFLGEGGKKRVYLAHDTLLDRDVAFALIKAEGLDEVSRSRIRREAQAMGRLGSHPHIVTVFDLGQE